MAAKSMSSSARSCAAPTRAECPLTMPWSAGPNPVHREPSTCARCLNFAVSTPHRPYWLDQSQRCEALPKEPALPTQTLKIARERLEESRAVLASIDESTKKGGHGRQAHA
jgi:hypothetical protein